MALLIEDCPRCGAERMTFDVWHALPAGMASRWQHWCELFCACRNCCRSTVFIVSQASADHDKLFSDPLNLVALNVSLNRFVAIEEYVSLRHMVKRAPPDHVPTIIEAAFKEGATCIAVQCWNAAGTMFRMCVDLATRPMLPAEDVEGLTRKTRRDLGLRLKWLFEHDALPEGLRELSTCIREDGNDGAHAGTLKKEDAEDLLDFTYELLERLYTEPQRLRLAEERRRARRQA